MNSFIVSWETEFENGIYGGRQWNEIRRKKRAEECECQKRGGGRVS